MIPNRSIAPLLATLLLLLPQLALAKKVVCRPGAKPIVLQSADVSFSVSPCGAGLESVRLLNKQFELTKDRTPKVVPKWAANKWKPGALELVGTWDAKWDPFRDRLADLKVGTVELTVKEPGEATVTTTTIDDLGGYYDTDSRWGVVQQDGESVTLVWPDPKRVKSPIYLSKRYSLIAERTRSLSVDVAVWNVGSRAAKFKLRHIISTWSDPNQEDGGLFAMLAGPPNLKSAAFHIREETVHHDINALKDADPEERSAMGTPNWLATDSRYFILASLPGKGWGQNGSVRLHTLTNGVVEAIVTSQGEALAPATGGCAPGWYTSAWGGSSCAADFKLLGLKNAVDAPIDAAFFDKARLAAAGGDKAAVEAAIARVQKRQVKAWQSQIYAGPKRIDYLRDVGGSVDDAIDFGWFGVIGRPLLMIMRFAHDFTGSWPLAIIILTVLVKALLWPVMGKSMKSMRKMQLLKPELDAIKKRLTKEAKAKGLDKPDPQELNKETFALYKRHGANPLGGCLPMFLQMPVYIALYRTIYSSVELYNQPLFGWITDLTQKDPYYALPVLLGAVMFLQQKIMPNPGGDEAQRKMLMYFMPIMFSFMMMSLPSGLTLYILVNTVLSIVQNLWLRREEKQTVAA
ncbi:MAG: YidC/Oxa1 family insertase periplasmic-domain containing protein [Myxococcales bacterium]|nr:YidC/Oxa1 family insertase periplasmic-domain containing protein [Myxococcales bacterium]